MAQTTAMMLFQLSVNQTLFQTGASSTNDTALFIFSILLIRFLIFNHYFVALYRGSASIRRRDEDIVALRKPFRAASTIEDYWSQAPFYYALMLVPHAIAFSRGEGMDVMTSLANSFEYLVTGPNRAVAALSCDVVIWAASAIIWHVMRD